MIALSGSVRLVCFCAGGDGGGSSLSCSAAACSCRGGGLGLCHQGRDIFGQLRPQRLDAIIVW
jgi:hypothetical protein